MDTRLIASCMTGSFAGTTAFPEIVDRLRAEGVERYATDLMQLQATYYAADGATQVVPMPLPDAPTIADAFDVAAVRDALASTQRREIGYPEFLRRMMAAGTVGYTVFINGQQTQYVGRHGDSYAEPFPWLA